MHSDVHAAANRALSSLLAINLLAGVATGMLQMAIPLFALSLKASTVQLGYISGAGGIGRLLVVIPSGLLIDRYGARLLFLSSTILSALSVLALLWTKSPTMLMSVMVLQSMGQAVSFLALQAGFLKRLPFLAAGKAGWQRGATQIGYYLMGPLLCGILLQDSWFRGVFGIASGVLAAALCLSWYRRRQGAREVTEPALGHGMGELAQLRTLLGSRTLNQVLTIECLGAAAFSIFRSFIAPVAVGLQHLQVSHVSFLILSQGMTAMFMLLGCGSMLKRVTPQRLYPIAGIVAIAGSLFIAGAGNFPMLGLGAVIFGCGTGLMSLASLSLIGQVQGEKGKIAALFSFSIGLGSTIGPILAGYLGELLSLKMVFLTTAPFILLSCLLFLPAKEAAVIIGSQGD